MTKTSNLKKAFIFLAIIAVICAVFAGIAVYNNQSGDVMAADENKVIKLQIDNPTMYVDNDAQPIDNEGTVPVVRNDRTLVPVRAIIEAAGGNIIWNDSLKEVTITYNTDTIRLVIDSTTA